MKQYVGLVCDHTGSMRHLASEAMSDYNSNIDTIKTESSRFSIDTIVSVVQCGMPDYKTEGPTLLRGGYNNGKKLINVSVVNSNVKVLAPLTSYPTPGHNTPLFDSVMKMIEIFKSVPDYNDPTVSFLVMVITDGQDNSSSVKGPEFALNMQQLLSTDRWTFVFRVPHGYKNDLVRLGINGGNILEWEQTSKGFAKATEITASGFSNYYSLRSAGQTSTNVFYGDTSKLTTIAVKTTLDDITPYVWPYAVRTNGEEIRDFVTRVYGSYVAGTAYYQLTKSEKIQANKKIIIYSKKDGHYYTGNQARLLIGLPLNQAFTLRPGQSPDYTIYIQSGSYNRHVVANTNILVYNG